MLPKLALGKNNAPKRHISHRISLVFSQNFELYVRGQCAVSYTPELLSFALFYLRPCNRIVLRLHYHEQRIVVVNER